MESSQDRVGTNEFLFAAGDITFEFFEYSRVEWRLFIIVDCLFPDCVDALSLADPSELVVCGYTSADGDF